MTTHTPALAAKVLTRPDRLSSVEREAIVNGYPGGDTRLGPCDTPAGLEIRVFMPGARRVELLEANGVPVASLEDVQADGIFYGVVVPSLAAALEGHYRLKVYWPDGVVSESEDPYDFAPQLSDLDIYLINEGTHRQLTQVLGANVTCIEGVSGTLFSVWAPHAQRVAVIGDFNGWDARRHVLHEHAGSGVWELFIPRIGTGERYKFALTPANRALNDSHRYQTIEKADPMARQAEAMPGTASIVTDSRSFEWADQTWMARRERHHPHVEPLSIYEVHVDSWRKQDGLQRFDWEQLTTSLIPYVKALGFTHIELLPITEYPYEDSWGYQPLGLYALTARLGEPQTFAAFVDACHQQEIGVLIDWVGAHFPADAHGLARFDGMPLYEYANPLEGVHAEWGSLVYDLTRPQVRGFLIGSALYWITHYHIDGLRVDAVASMLYRDYSRRPGQWIPNSQGGRENIEAIHFLRQLNDAIHLQFPHVMTIAEESTDWPGVTAPTSTGGLGFTFKWNMGWMHDTLSYMARNPIHRRFHHSEITFSFWYAPSEYFVLPLSHDEVVHGKGALLAKMTGADPLQKRAALRAYLAFMWGHPGKKLLFMGSEFGVWQEWDFRGQLDWSLLEYEPHQGILRLLTDLNHIYVTYPPLYGTDRESSGYQVMIGDDCDNSVMAFLRRHEERMIMVISNFTPVIRSGYQVNVPQGGRWREILNTDSEFYDGTGAGNYGSASACGEPGHYWLSLVLPPMATLYLMPDQEPVGLMSGNE